MTRHDPHLTAQMPQPAPLDMPLQDFSKPHQDPEALKLGPMQPAFRTGLFRLGTFLPAIATSMALFVIIMDWFRRDGFTAIEIAMMAMVAFTSFWIALSVASSTIGLFFARKDRPADASSPEKALDVALLIPVYNEDPDAVLNVQENDE